MFESSRPDKNRSEYCFWAVFLGPKTGTKKSNLSFLRDQQVRTISLLDKCNRGCTIDGLNFVEFANNSFDLSARNLCEPFIRVGGMKLYQFYIDIRKGGFLIDRYVLRLHY